MTSPNELEGAVERAAAILKAWNRRETDLLEANNRYLERARAAETALASITRERDEAREAWTWLYKNTNLELDHRYEDEDDDGGTWRVHRVNGGVNDREWTLVAKGRTPLEAVQRARAAALVNVEGGK